MPVRPNGKPNLGGCKIAGRYIVHSQLGTGAHSVVYGAVDEKDNGRPVALKVEHRVGGGVRPLIRDESWWLRQLGDLPCVPRFVDFIEDEPIVNGSVLVLELLGDDLRTALRRSPGGKFSDRTVAYLGCQMLTALEDVHKRKIVHRDVKPANVILGREGDDRLKVYIVDFGLVRRHLDENGTPRPSRKSCPFRGTTHYASMEAQNCKDIGRVDDLWSLFFMLIEMTMGRLPWEGIYCKNMSANAKTNAKKRVLEEKRRLMAAMTRSSPRADPDLKQACRYASQLPKPILACVREIAAYSYESVPNYDTLRGFLKEVGTKESQLSAARKDLVDGPESRRMEARDADLAKMCFKASQRRFEAALQRRLMRMDQVKPKPPPPKKRPAPPARGTDPNKRARLLLGAVEGHEASGEASGDADAKKSDEAEECDDLEDVVTESDPPQSESHASAAGEGLLSGRDDIASELPAKAEEPKGKKMAPPSSSHRERRQVAPPRPGHREPRHRHHKHHRHHHEPRPGSHHRRKEHRKDRHKHHRAHHKSRLEAGRLAKPHKQHQQQVQQQRRSRRSSAEVPGNAESKHAEQKVPQADLSAEPAPGTTAGAPVELALDPAPGVDPSTPAANVPTREDGSPAQPQQAQAKASSPPGPVSWMALLAKAGIKEVPKTYSAAHAVAVDEATAPAPIAEAARAAAGDGTKSADGSAKVSARAHGDSPRPGAHRNSSSQAQLQHVADVGKEGASKAGSMPVKLSNTPEAEKKPKPAAATQPPAAANSKSAPKEKMTIREEAAEDAQRMFDNSGTLAACAALQQQTQALLASFSKVVNSSDGDTVGVKSGGGTSRPPAAKAPLAATSPMPHANSAKVAAPAATASTTVAIAAGAAAATASTEARRPAAAVAVTTRSTRSRAGAAAGGSRQAGAAPVAAGTGAAPAASKASTLTVGGAAPAATRREKPPCSTSPRAASAPPSVATSSGRVAQGSAGCRSSSRGAAGSAGARTAALAALPAAPADAPAAAECVVSVSTSDGGQGVSVCFLDAEPALARTRPSGSRPVNIYPPVPVAVKPDSAPQVDGLPLRRSARLKATVK